MKRLIATIGILALVGSVAPTALAEETTDITNSGTAADAVNTDSGTTDMTTGTEKALKKGSSKAKKYGLKKKATTKKVEVKKPVKKVKKVIKKKVIKKKKAGKAMKKKTTDDAVDTTINATTPQTHDVSIANLAFAENAITAKVGDTVKWVNNDGMPHTVTADNGAFDGGTMETGEEFNFTFTQAGTWTYHCALHPSMTGTITVSE